MTPLHIVAEMETRLILPPEGIHLDALLMAAVARRDDAPPLYTQADAVEAQPLDIPIALSACGRYYLATTSIQHVSEREHRWLNRRFPLQEAIALGGPKVRRIQQSEGACKAYRIPVETAHVAELHWYAVGDADGVRRLLDLVSRLGRRRAVGEGTVLRWRVVELDEVWDGFPTLSADGAAMRHLPLDVEGLRDYAVRIGCVRPPYWARAREQEVACPP
jgi:CRISPR type IV-associated protein Csf3